MVTLEQMAEAHLLNVQREVSNLQQQKQKVDAEIEKLTNYFNEGVKVLNESKAAPKSQDVVPDFGGISYGT
jgi:chaperonin cofactor prefoldin